VSAMDARPDVRVFGDTPALDAATAAWLAAELAGCVRENGRVSFVLSGGHTPETLYQLLASRFRDEVPWPRVHVFWSDERYVPHDDSLSNYRMAKHALLDRVAIPPAQIHPMPTHFPDPQTAARDYEATLAAYFPAAPLVAFDLMLLGIGADGHTASVFTGSPAMTSTRPVLAVTAPAEPPSRLTLTLPVIARARHIGVLVAGASKAPALAAALRASGDGGSPAAVLARTAPSLVWWVDRHAWSAAAKEHRDVAF
jgi:6-phosphogluconolactonase